MTKEQYDNDVRSMMDTIFTSAGSTVRLIMPVLDEPDYESRGALFHFWPGKDCANLWGAVHGGVTASLFDIAMGVCAKGVSGKRETPTISLQTTYVRPVRMEKLLHIRARVTACDGQVCSTTAEAWQDDPALLCASASASFFLKGIPKVSGSASEE